jgi:hypothetical protein
MRALVTSLQMTGIEYLDLYSGHVDFYDTPTGLAEIKKHN